MTPKTRAVLTCAVLGASLLGVAFGGRLAGEARQTAALASRFAQPDAERAAREACASPAPVVVLDTFAHFRPANIDDGRSDPADRRRPELRHGDIVAAITLSSRPGIVAWQTDPAFNVRTLAVDFGRLASEIESGRLARPAAVMSSIVLPVDLGLVNARLWNGTPFGGAELAARRRDLLRLLTDDFNAENPYAEIDRHLGRLRAAGVPVFVAAGNTGPDETVNVLALSEGVYAVGALDRDGAPTAYTSAPGFVSVWSPGYVVVSEAPGGLSVSRGRKVEMDGAALPQEKAVIAEFSGRGAEALVQEMVQEAGHLGRMRSSRRRNLLLHQTLAPGLYRTADLMAAYGYAPSLETFRRAIAEGPYMHFPTDTIFKTDAEGKLVFDPIGDRSAGQLKVADATSFAVPNLCAAELVFDPPATSGRARSGS